MALQQSLDGETILDPELETVLQNILIDQTPESWLLKSFPSSLSLPSFIMNLQERVNYMREILETPGIAKLTHFWLPGLFDPGNFFSILL
mmetsp:Transcript_12587/g.19604  ORF Transcript_12587/g.19604 Transcript_12587/m.19604 type:complete len:90 (+) Transcript_12587:5242-5511(+)